METGFCLVYSDDILHGFKDDIYQCRELTSIVGIMLN